MLESERRSKMAYLGENIKKLGFGLMRLPVLDEADRKSIDYSTLNKMVDEFMAAGLHVF